MSKKKIQPSIALKEAVIKGMLDLKAKDVVCIDLRNIKGAVTDFFVICHGDSNTHVEGISGSIFKVVKEITGERPWHEEGKSNAEWLLLDYVDVVAHVFQREARDFYQIEELWADAPIERIKD
jgi:ribosome-associated protein